MNPSAKPAPVDISDATVKPFFFCSGLRNSSFHNIISYIVSRNKFSIKDTENKDLCNTFFMQKQY